MEAVKSPIFGHETRTSVPTCSCSSSFVDIDWNSYELWRTNSNILKLKILKYRKNLFSVFISFQPDFFSRFFYFHVQSSTDNSKRSTTPTPFSHRRNFPPRSPLLLLQSVRHAHKKCDPLSFPSFSASTCSAPSSFILRHPPFMLIHPLACSSRLRPNESSSFMASTLCLSFHHICPTQSTKILPTH